MLILLKTDRMMMMIRKTGLFVLFLLVAATVFAQGDDFGIWYGVSAEHKISHRLDASISADVRTFNKASKIDEAFLEGGLNYSLSKVFSVAANYRLTKALEDNNSYYLRHKVLIDFKGSFPVGRFDLSARLRFQSMVKNYVQDENDDKPQYTARVRLKALYRTPSFPLNPYLGYESFSPVFSDKTRTIEKNRFTVGTDIKLAKKQSVSVEYIFQRDFLPHISDINVISLNYNIRF